MRQQTGGPRLIPAHAGSTWHSRMYGACMRAHPRSRGEHPATPAHYLKQNGSSPLTRGARQERLTERRFRGLIPAHAGSTRQQPLRVRSPRAHPRSRGEHDDAWALVVAYSGSSPLTRGALGNRPCYFGIGRLIPAHAGSTKDCYVFVSEWGAHPRSRGEHFIWGVIAWALTGSSPLTRGALAGRDVDMHPRGLIPAHAGSTSSPPWAEDSSSAHPRSRGEHGGELTEQPAALGSSPLTRGALGVLRLPRNPVGLIPAHAGSTGGKRATSAPTRAHPRSRGEHSALRALRASCRGSSPLTRGARVPALSTRIRQRLIPAHAGSTWCE